MENRVKAWLFEAPAILLLIASAIAGIYAAAKGGYGVSWPAAIILIIIVILFFIGKKLESSRY